MEPSIEIDVQGQVIPDYHLDITLTSKSLAPLTVYEHSLPWASWNSMLLISARTDALGTLMEKSSLIDDPGPATTTIKPGETLRGQIALVSRFPGFPDAIKERDVLIFWSYQLHPIGATPLTRACGCVLFQKTPK